MQIGSHPVLQNDIQFGLNNRIQNIGGYNQGMHSNPMNYFAKSMNQQRQQPLYSMNQQQQQYPQNQHQQHQQQQLQNGERHLNVQQNNEQVQVNNFGGGMKYQNKQKMNAEKVQALTPQQIVLLDRIENIKKKGNGYAEDKQAKFPPLLQFPNLQTYVGEKSSPDVDKPLGQQNHAFNQKHIGNIINVNYRPQNDTSRNSQYNNSNNPYVKSNGSLLETILSSISQIDPYDNYNKGNKLPRLEQAIALGQPNTYIAGPSPLMEQENIHDKRKKQSYQYINIHNSQLLTKMMDSSHSLPTSIQINPLGNNISNNIVSTSPNQNVKQYQNALSPIKKYQNNTIPPLRGTPEKNSLGQSNAFNKIEEFNSQSSSSNSMFKVSLKTKAGCTIQKVTKTNQDSAIVQPKILSDINITQFAVGDGHGLNGHLVSQLIKRNLPKNVHKFLKPDDYSPENIRNAINRGFFTTNHEIFAADFDTNLSGSTLISVFIHENKLYCGNVGDSRAVIGKQKSNISGFKAHPLSIDHKPSLERERHRIVKNGGRVDCQRDYNGQPLGPLRVWLPSMDIPGLAMTRSMGDKVGVQAGVIGEPEIEELDITEEDKFMVVASDGVWEYLTDQEVIKFVGPYYERGQVEQAAEKLIVESTNAWRRESLVRDDITCIVVFFNHSVKGGQKQYYQHQAPQLQQQSAYR